MTEIYVIITGFMLILAVFDLFVGVSNDAVNFLNSAIGAKVARFKTILAVASFGVIIGAVMSSGMMDLARHGILQPSYYSFEQVMTIFLAVMITDVIILDIFNTLGLPTSTTVSLVFELLGATFVAACVKIATDHTLSFNMLLNGNKALNVIIGIFTSVAIAFVAGVIVQWLVRLIFTFNYKKRLKYFIGIFGGIAFTALAYFIFCKGLGKSPYISATFRNWIDTNTRLLIPIIFLFTTLLSQCLHFLRVNVLKIIVLTGTFSLAMAFAGNDLVNFIGVPLAALDSMLDFLAHGNGNISGHLMESLASSSQSPIGYLILAGIIMIVAMATSKKARNVVKTELGLSRHNEGEEMFGSSQVARSIVRSSQKLGDLTQHIVPSSTRRWIANRFNKEEIELEDGAAYDEIRAAVNLVLSALLIIMGTTLQLPLSTTYVTFMVAMGSSLADKAWGRESAAFRITGVLTVIGGWFMTAGIAFLTAALFCLAMLYGGVIAMFALMGLALIILFRSNRKYNRKHAESVSDNATQLLDIKDSNQLFEALTKHFAHRQAQNVQWVNETFHNIFNSLKYNDLKSIRKIKKSLNEEHNEYKRNRRLELLALRRSPIDKAVERNTWFHLTQNSNQQYIYCLKRMVAPVLEHLDNGFSPMPQSYISEFETITQRLDILFQITSKMMDSGEYLEYHETMEMADQLKNKLSTLRKTQINRIQLDDPQNLTVSQLHLNLIQETQELLSIMRHQLRATRKFVSKN